MMQSTVFIIMKRDKILYV